MSSLWNSQLRSETPSWGSYSTYTPSTPPARTLLPTLRAGESGPFESEFDLSGELGAWSEL